MLVRRMDGAITYPHGRETITSHLRYLSRTTLVEMDVVSGEEVVLGELEDRIVRR